MGLSTASILAGFNSPQPDAPKHKVRGPPKVGGRGLANKTSATVPQFTVTGTLTYWAVIPANEASSNFKLRASCDFG